MPLWAGGPERGGSGEVAVRKEKEIAAIGGRARELGLCGLDAPKEFDGMDLPTETMIGVQEELGRTVTPYTLPPDSPNLRMLMSTVNDEQRIRYLEPYARGEKQSAIAISEPGAGA